MNRLKVLATVLAASFGISFLGGFLGWYIAEGFVALLGLVDIVCVVWILVIVYKKQ